jgi:hypothetical protein
MVELTSKSYKHLTDCMRRRFEAIIRARGDYNTLLRGQGT